MAPRLRSSCTQKRSTGAYSATQMSGKTFLHFDNNRKKHTHIQKHPFSLLNTRSYLLTSLFDTCTSLPSQPSPHFCSLYLMGESAVKARRPTQTESSHKNKHESATGSEVTQRPLTSHLSLRWSASVGLCIYASQSACRTAALLSIGRSLHRS